MPWLLFLVSNWSEDNPDDVIISSDLSGATADIVQLSLSFPLKAGMQWQCASSDFEIQQPIPLKGRVMKTYTRVTAPMKNDSSDKRNRPFDSVFK